MEKTFIICGITKMMHTISCKFYVPQETKSIYFIRNSRLKDDRVRCGKGKNRKVGYYSRTALRCLWCAQRHGYVVQIQRNKIGDEGGDKPCQSKRSD